MDASVERVSMRAGGLRSIPLIDLGRAGPVALARRSRAVARALIASARRDYGSLALRLASGLSARWLSRAGDPYRDEIAAVAAVLGESAAWTLNLSYEWFCTTGTAPDPGGEGNRLMRTLDWPLEGLGRHVVVAREEAAAGVTYNVTWPGFVGMVTAMAPGRFAAAINQAPMRRAGLPLALDWGLVRLGVWRRQALPPAHLLRRVFDHAASYAEARAMLIETPICLPAFFVLSGLAPGEGCIIERLEDEAFVHEGPLAVANDWLTPGLDGTPRGAQCETRRGLLTERLATVADGFAWVVPPVLNACTRVAVVTNAATGRLLVQGWEADGPATAVFDLARARAA